MKMGEWYTGLQDTCPTFAWKQRNFPLLWLILNRHFLMCARLPISTCSTGQDERQSIPLLLCMKIILHSRWLDAITRQRGTDVIDNKFYSTVGL